MTRIEYEKELQLLDELVSTAQFGEKHQERLEELYGFKPVSMKWFVVKSKALILQGKPKEVLSRFKDRVNRDYTYSENIELWEQVIRALEMCKIHSEGKRQRYMYSRIVGNDFCKEVDCSLKSSKERFINGDISQENLADLEELYYVSNQKLLSYMVYLYKILCYPEMKKPEDPIKYTGLDNMGYFGEYVHDKKPVILISSGNEVNNYDILMHILNRLGVPVYMIGELVDIEGDYRLIDAVQVSIENAQSYEDGTVIPAVRRTENGQIIGDNIPYLVDYLCKNHTENDFALVVTTNNQIEHLRTHKDISKRFERLSGYEAKMLEDELGFGRAGSYYEHISRLYGFDVKKWVNAEPECDFSIVVPARNATETLFYTLRTCLEQDYTGTFEVVLSDNSTNGNSAVYDTYLKLNDKRIKYYKTPRDLNLAKSFEYAYFRTKGRFIIPLGADDAILPWALDTLKTIIDDAAFEKVDVITWIRGFYAWPGFNGGQEHQFVIPKYFDKNKKVATYDNPIAYLKAVVQDPQLMYILPNMYINSGFRRDYLDKMHTNAGYILDGWAQDIYTGLTNLATGAVCLRIDYPITIAGMSSSSVGSISKNTSGGENVNLNKVYATMFGGTGIYNYIEMVERLPFPHVGTDVSGMYRSVSRLISKNFLPKNFLTEEDLKIIYKNYYDSISLLGDKYMQYVLEGKELAEKVSVEFSGWYQKEILKRGEQLYYVSKDISKTQKKTKTYIEGYSSGGGVVLDASRYGVTNIYDAVHLFKEFLHF